MPTISYMYPSRAIPIVPGIEIEIPNPSTLKASGAATSTVVSELNDTNADFLKAGIVYGDIIHNTTDETKATVTKVVSATSLEISANIMANTEDYVIYPNYENKGCLVLINTVAVTGKLLVRTPAGDDVSLDMVAASVGKVIPFQITHLSAAGGSYPADVTGIALFN